MDSKGEESKMSYPNIFFMIDSFEEVSRRAWLLCPWFPFGCLRTGTSFRRTLGRGLDACQCSARFPAFDSARELPHLSLSVPICIVCHDC